jgi:predicted nucleic acid-binding protein
VDRLFLDANVLFSTAYRDGSPLCRLWDRQDAEILTSGYAVLEAERHLQDDQRARLAELLKRVRIVAEAPDRPLPGRVVLRAKDVPILAAAVAAGATHLITGDRRDFGPHFGQMIAGVLIVPPRDYLEPGSGSQGSRKGSPPPTRVRARRTSGEGAGRRDKARK